jgi:hypothetical protein
MEAMLVAEHCRREISVLWEIIDKLSQELTEVKKEVQTPFQNSILDRNHEN